MTITELIEDDIKSLEKYFKKLFELWNESINEERRELEKTLTTNFKFDEEKYVHTSQFIKPDMLIHIYSLLDFWLKKICNHHKKIHNLDLSHKDIKGIHDLDAYQKYLTKVAKVDLQKVNKSYEQLNNVRIVRNKFIHNGGHIVENELNTFTSIKGISISMSIIVIDESFIYDSLDHTKKYLFESAKF